MNHLPLIIKREYLTKLRNKAFIIMTFLSPLIIIVLISIVAYLTQINSDKIRRVSILDQSGLIQHVFKDSEKTKYTYLKGVSLDNAKIIVEAKGDYGLLYIGEIDNFKKANEAIRFYSEDTPASSFITTLDAAIEKELTNLKMTRLGVTPEIIKTGKINIDITQETYDGKQSSKIDSGIKIAFGIATGYLLFMFIIIYGNMIMRSVIEEKTSRIIEVIISSVRPIQLLLGKIIGTSLVGITQVFIWVVIGLILTAIIPIIFGIDLSQSGMPQQEAMQQVMQEVGNNSGQTQQFITAFFNLPLANLIIAFILFFICGYLLYSSLYAAIGAAVNSETDTQQFIMPIILPLILAVYVGGFTVIEEPHGTIATVFSFLPFTSPVVMLMRIPFGVPIWEQLLSLVILFGTFMLTVWFASKIYRIGILMYGKKPTYKELVKWIKY